MVLDSEISEAASDDIYVPSLWSSNSLRFLPDCTEPRPSLSTLPSRLPSMLLWWVGWLCCRWRWWRSMLQLTEVCLTGEKRIGTSENNSNPTPNEERELTTHHEDMYADVQEVLGEVVEMVSTTGDVDVVEEETHFSSASAQILISEIMVCNRDLEKMKQNIPDVQKRLSNIIDILGKI
ncbi:hypothetical protein AB205_0174320 [Aquarana catesbeiana]|uniref:Uncharacterized protein n=2 Tax=Aquarana catesbeiana TaxID=8400 RepID=A0A2G9S0I4_AQUCT|nr:hypothetical protein AB205_0174320 [Aquarana catesbeiana]